MQIAMQIDLPFMKKDIVYRPTFVVFHIDIVIFILPDQSLPVHLEKKI